MPSPAPALRGTWFPLLLLALVISAALYPPAAHAAAAGGGGLPWDTPLTTLKNDLTGPVRSFLSVVSGVSHGRPPPPAAAACAAGG